MIGRQWIARRTCVKGPTFSGPDPTARIAVPRELPAANLRWTRSPKQYTVTAQIKGRTIGGFLMRSPIGAILGASLLAFLAVPSALCAQATTGTIYGTVVDQSRSILPGVTIEVKNVENGATRTLVTDSNGHYRALSLRRASTASVPSPEVAERATFRF